MLFVYALCDIAVGMSHQNQVDWVAGWLADWQCCLSPHSYSEAIKCLNLKLGVQVQLSTRMMPMFLCWFFIDFLLIHSDICAAVSCNKSESISVGIGRSLTTAVCCVAYRVIALSNQSINWFICMAAKSWIATCIN